MQQPLILKPNVTIFFHLKTTNFANKFISMFRLKLHSIIKETSHMHIHILSLDYIFLCLIKEENQLINFTF